MTEDERAKVLNALFQSHLAKVKERMVEHGADGVDKYLNGDQSDINGGLLAFVRRQRERE